MKLFQVTHNSPLGVKLTAEVIAPTADEAVEAFYKGQVRTQEVERSAPTKMNLLLKERRFKMEDAITNINDSLFILRMAILINGFLILCNILKMWEACNA